MHPSVELIHPEANGVQGMDSGTEEGEEDRFSWREGLALLGGKRGELLGRKGYDATSSFEVTGEEASTWVDVGFRGGSCVGPRGGRQREEENQALPWSGLRDAKPKRGEESGVGGDRAPSDLVFVKCRGRKVKGAERVTTLRPEAALYTQVPHEP